MTRVLLAATALIASSFTPIALPVMVEAAVALPAANVLLCTDSALLGPPANGHFWGNPYILPTHNAVTGTLGAPSHDGGSIDHYSGTEAIDLQAVVQRCPVMNQSGHPTGQYQDVVLTASHHTTFDLECEHTPEMTIPYLDCQISRPVGGSGDDR